MCYEQYELYLDRDEDFISNVPADQKEFWERELKEIEEYNKNARHVFGQAYDDAYGPANVYLEIRPAFDIYGDPIPDSIGLYAYSEEYLDDARSLFNRLVEKQKRINSEF